MKSIKKNFPKFLLALLLSLLFIGFFGKRILQIDRSRDTSFPEEALVIAVYDGDTVKVRFRNGQQKKVRLIGINAPEIDDPREEVKFRAYMAKRFSFFYLYRQKITLTYDWELEDKYGRLLAYIWTERQGLFNKFILKEGFASIFLFFPFRKDYRAEFIEAERDSQRLEKGFWKEGNFPSISVHDIRGHIGRLLSVEFTCGRIEFRRKFILLHSSVGEFSAFIPRENLPLFPEIQSFQDKELSVTGFLEDYKGRPQIFVFLSRQIQIVD